MLADDVLARRRVASSKILGEAVAARVMAARRNVATGKVTIAEDPVEEEQCSICGKEIKLGSKRKTYCNGRCGNRERERRK